jgi:hypothetical protein
MPHYLLSTHACAGDEDAPAATPMTQEEMQAAFGKVMLLQDEMRAAGAFVFGGKLHDPDTASVVRMANGNVVTTDGPFLESKEHLGGFYILIADDLDSALEWAGRVTELIGQPIEVRPFAGEPES